MEDTWKDFREIRQENFSMLANLVPLAQTPQSREGVSAMKRLSRQIQNMVQRIAPWTKSERDGLVSAELRKKIGSGNVVVMLESGERADLDIYKEAEKLRE